ncbi:MAG: LamG-like jellyroll fold domain-containing protein, partial [Pirellulaceae bacterium]
NDFAWSAKFKTDSDGTLICKTLDQSDWMQNGQSLFVRDGRLAFDIGWVGAVRSNVKVADGKWHTVVLNWHARDSKVAFFVDGKPAGEGSLKAKKPLKNSIIRIGATNDNFPETSFFRGEIAETKLFSRVLLDEEIKNPDLQKVDDCFAAWNEFSGATVKDRSGHDRDATRIGKSNAESEFKRTGLLVTAFTEGGPIDHRQWITDEVGNLRLRIPAGQEPIRLQINMTSLATADNVDAIEKLTTKQPIAIADLTPLTKGGPANWPDVLSAELQLGNTPGPFVVDVLSHPTKNPGNDRFRMTGVDFVPEKDEMIVATWDGSIWRVSGIGQTIDKAPLRWRRIAAGLFQPLGIKIRDGVTFVTCRDQLVALHDLNDDGEIDWYESFNNDHQVTEHFHEFAMGLQTDAEGNFYYAKSARHALPALVPHHGTLLKVSADGKHTEIIANGFRAANGVCLNPDGSFVVTDQEGHWNPKNRINWVTGGGFYGNMFGYHDVVDSSDSAMEPPLCWITNAMDRSPAELLWVDSDRWGPLKGSLLNLSYGYGKIFIVPHEKVGGKMQGGMCELPLPQFPTGIMRGRFHPVDGQLYACGMFAWSSTQEQPGGLYRIRYAGGDVKLPVGLRAIAGGLEVTFTEPLSPESASDPANFSIQAWDLKRSANYGSEHLNEHRLTIRAAELTSDGRTVRLSIPDIAPTWGMEIVYALKTKDGQPFQGKIHNTIHELEK